MTPTTPQAPRINPVRLNDGHTILSMRPAIGDWCTFNGGKQGRVVSTDMVTTCIADGEALHWVATHTVLVRRMKVAG